jgi:hypothetical protein
VCLHKPCVPSPPRRAHTSARALSNRGTRGQTAYPLRAYRYLPIGCMAKVTGGYVGLAAQDNKLRNDPCPGGWAKLSPNFYGGNMGFQPEDSYCTWWDGGTCKSYGGKDEERKAW